MKKQYFWCLIAIISIGILPAQNKLSTKRPTIPKNKAAYQRYESNDMGLFRAHNTFTKPTVKEEEVIIKVEDTLNRYRRVEPFLKENKRYYVDASPNIAKMSEKHPKPVAQTTAPVAATPTYTYTPTTTTTTRPKKSAPVKARGYRVQLFNGQDREQANRVKNQFISAFPEIPRYLIFVEPTYRVRVGDFYTKEDAENFLRDVKKISIFSDAIVIRDIVEFREDDGTKEEVAPEN